MHDYVHRVSKNVAYSIFYDLKKAEPIIINNILIILVSRKDQTHVYCTWQFFRVAEITYFHTSLLCL